MFDRQGMRGLALGVDVFCCEIQVLDGEETNRKLAEASGRSLGIVGYTLKRLEREGLISALGRCEGLPRRVIVLMDHREARRLVRNLELAHSR